MSIYPDGYKNDYVRAVTRGEGWATGQKQESGSPVRETGENVLRFNDFRYRR